MEAPDGSSSSSSSSSSPSSRAFVDDARVVRSLPDRDAEFTPGAFRELPLAVPAGGSSPVFEQDGVVYRSLKLAPSVAGVGSAPSMMAPPSLKPLRLSGGPSPPPSLMPVSLKRKAAAFADDDDDVSSDDEDDDFSALSARAAARSKPSSASPTTAAPVAAESLADIVVPPLPSGPYPLERTRFTSRLPVADLASRIAAALDDEQAVVQLAAAQGKWRVCLSQAGELLTLQLRLYAAADGETLVECQRRSGSGLHYAAFYRSLRAAVTRTEAVEETPASTAFRKTAGQAAKLDDDTLRPLVEGARSSFADVSLQAARALASLATVPDNREAMLAGGCMPPLLALLSSLDSAVSYAALAALAGLLALPAAAAAAAASEAPKLLLQLLATSAADEQRAQHARLSLRVLADLLPSQRARMVDADAASVLAPLLHCDDPRMRSSASALLAALAA